MSPIIMTDIKLLKGKTVLLGVSGGIAAYKCPELVRLIKKAGAVVHVAMTSAAAHFVTPLTLQTLTGNRVHQEMFDIHDERDIGHISLAERADIILIAPATADIISKIANGICDDLLSTVVCATKSPVLFSPSMNTNMWENPIIQENAYKLKKHGYFFIEPEDGELACGTSGAGRLPELRKILEKISDVLAKK